jgi:hypothetical protein
LAVIETGKTDEGETGFYRALALDLVVMARGAGGLVGFDDHAVAPQVGLVTVDAGNGRSRRRSRIGEVMSQM